MRAYDGDTLLNPQVRIDSVTNSVFDTPLHALVGQNAIDICKDKDLVTLQKVLFCLPNPSEVDVAKA